MNAKQRIFPYLKNVAKPGRYTGGEVGETIKDKNAISTRFAFLFPDTYEIGMSNLGIKILYGILNQKKEVWCERCFAPWNDMGALLRERNLPLYALESGDSLQEFDFLGVTLQYELSYTNLLYCLSLASIPFFASERGEEFPILLGGGPCAYNPEPVADFFDLFSVGEGEESICELVDLYTRMKRRGDYTKPAYLREAAKIKGTYVPSLYDVTYGGKDNTVQSVTPKYADVPKKVLKRVIRDFDGVYFPDNLPVPFIETVHDRILLEAARGCTRGCRFCQAGVIYRPYREKSPDTINRQATALARSTGYDEISLNSLSISDYSELSALVDCLKEWTDPRKIGLSLPSMRIDSFEARIMEKIQGVRKSGLTFAPEAGTQRLRDVINKNLTEEEILSGCREAFRMGRTNVKLYFMLGLPTETDEDITAIASLAQKIVNEFYNNKSRQKGRGVEVTVSVSCFVPKAHTPFQWEGQDRPEELIRKQKLLGASLRSGKIRYSWHEAATSYLEAVFARGDRRLSRALVEAHKLGVRFDGWDEFFSFEKWMAAFDSARIDPSFYANRPFSHHETLPWSHIDSGVSQRFLQREHVLARQGKTTPDCAALCSHCGAARFGAALCGNAPVSDQ